MPCLSELGALLTMPSQVVGHIRDNATAVMVMNGALLAMISVRNQHLSDRARVATSELIPHTSNERRRNSLRRQAKCFIARYFFTSLSFILMTISLACFGGVIINALTISSPEILSGIGIWSFAGGVVLLILEFVFGPLTLIMNFRSSRSS